MNLKTFFGDELYPNQGMAGWKSKLMEIQTIINSDQQQQNNNGYILLYASTSLVKYSKKYFFARKLICMV